MRRTALVFLLIASTAAGAAQEEVLQQIPEEHRKWLEEEVRYITTDQERDLFLALQTLEERELFIAAFWAKRDPNASTSENEFKDEHYRRLDYANKFLGRESFVPGWRTDRGRYHIILGEPQSIQRFVGYSQLKEAELWFSARARRRARRQNRR